MHAFLSFSILLASVMPGLLNCFFRVFIISQHSDFNSEIKLSARSADLPAAIDSALHRLVPALCAPLLNETAAALRAGIVAELDAARDMFKHVDDRTKVQAFIIMMTCGGV
jgi:hypothetical protein